MFNRGGLYYHHLNYDNSRDEDFYPHLIDIERLSRLLNWKTTMKFVFSELSTEKASLSLLVLRDYSADWRKKEGREPN